MIYAQFRLPFLTGDRSSMNVHDDLIDGVNIENDLYGKIVCKSFDSLEI